MNKYALIQGLNEDLAAELGTVIRYTYQAAKCQGLLAAEMKLEEMTADEAGHGRELRRLLEGL